MNYDQINDAYALIMPFGIDNGELSGLTPQHIFCYGVEVGKVQDVCEQLKNQPHGRIGVYLPVHSPNVPRLLKVIEQYGHHANTAWINDDWQQLQISRPGPHPIYDGPTDSEWLTYLADSGAVDEMMCGNGDYGMENVSVPIRLRKISEKLKDLE